MLMLMARKSPKFVSHTFFLFASFQTIVYRFYKFQVKKKWQPILLSIIKSNTSNNSYLINVRFFGEEKYIFYFNIIVTIGSVVFLRTFSIRRKIWGNNYIEKKTSSTISNIEGLKNVEVKTRRHFLHFNDTIISCQMKAWAFLTDHNEKKQVLIRKASIIFQSDFLGLDFC